MWIGAELAIRTRVTAFGRAGAQVALRVEESEVRRSCIIDESARHALASFFALHEDMDIDRWAPRFASHLPPVDAVVSVR